MPYLDELIADVNKSHPHLGELLAVSMLAVKAKKFLIVVSPRGCGKSRVSSFIGLSSDNASLQDRLSVAGLTALQSEFSGFDGVLVVDDIGKTQTPYARVTTITTIAELVYSGYCISHLQGSDYEIRGFEGSAIVNVQPVLLKEVIKSPEWEASIMDKSIRYYHLYRPQYPNPLPPDVQIKWGVSIKEVETPKLKGKLANKLCRIGEVQWGLARLKEHLADLLKASAAIDKRFTVTTYDYRLLIRLLLPMTLEGLVCDKIEFEAKRYLSSNTLAVLTALVTYGEVSLKQLARDYKLSESRTRQILAKMGKDWQVVNINPTVYAPSEELRKKLKEVGIK